MTGIALELMTNAIQVGIAPTMIRALALLPGYGLVGELLVYLVD